MPLPGITGGRVSCQILPSDLPDSSRPGQCKVKWTTGKGWYKCHTDLSKCTHVLFMWLILHTHVKKKLLNSISLKLDFILGFGGFFSVNSFIFSMVWQCKSTLRTCIWSKCYLVTYSNFERRSWIINIILCF